ncbi:taurine catabolism dioxygenase TauD [Pleurocapsa sp. CCALA 161]|uniref:TauD/TfdA family dioxygenase n=1 Tax=Pleurocapsa sp. CCALA 161 TaxID=2107688 RepID=UPI000D06052B|nr:TauD/TfdA family dioxygenase [Pleurocapsa sp. CCALA 161]PSB11066.1 taurine catabolism dioxygenase TauD [Pleurocapsa sp. CCALA 161]
MKTEISKFRKINRKPINSSPEKLIKTEFLHREKEFPLVIKPIIKGLDPISWGTKNREFVEKNLLKYGAILFRNFEIETVDKFEQFIAAICQPALEYKYRASPRTQVSGNIYTSTDYPADQSIFPHNEHSYSPTFPLRILFFCLTPASAGGETPIGRCRNILQQIDRDIQERFQAKKIMYLRNFGDGFGLPWQTVFQTTDKTKVEAYCRQNNIQWKWKGEEGLRTRQVGSAFVSHPQTKEKVWFNHATFFHVSTLKPQIRDALFSGFKEENLPTNTYYGDGSPIEASVLDHLRNAYQQEMITFSWQKGDVLLLDNMLAVHGRYPYQGVRKIVVGMAQAINSKDVAVK